MDYPMGKTAELYRMVMEDHTCPYGLKSRHLLQQQGFEVKDHHLTSREETEAFKRQHKVETTNRMPKMMKPHTSR